MDIQPTTVINLTIALTGDEARQILVDPAHFQRDLRAALAAHISTHSNSRSSTGGKSISLTKRARSAAPVAPRPKGIAGGERCPQCGESFKHLKKHARFCPGAAAGAV